jgi:hypothetical protein
MPSGPQANSHLTGNANATITNIVLAINRQRRKGLQPEFEGGGNKKS